MNPHPQLPKELIDRIFAEMACQYGRRFAEMWAGIDPDTVKAFWARKLGGFADYPQAIRAALDALDDRPFPPTCPEFSAMCRDALRRNPAGPALPAPTIDISVAKARLAEAKRRIGGRS
jgi:hypothetical protein